MFSKIVGDNWKLPSENNKTLRINQNLFLELLNINGQFQSNQGLRMVKKMNSFHFLNKK